MIKMVFDVSAESGGALSVLNDFYNQYKDDRSNNYIFVISRPELKETKNIKVLQYPWIKKSWLHRLYFDNFVASKLIKKFKADEVLSLQNIIVPHTKVYQTVYVHNSLPFVDFRFTLMEEKLLWVYQNLIGKIIIKSIIKADKVIVQTKWMKKACIDKTGIESNKIDVIQPQMNVKIKDFFNENAQSLPTFFYPASGYIFKNHKIIVEACKELKRKKITEFKIVFTLRGNENKNISELYKVVKEQSLPIEFVGSLSREQVFDLYTRSILLFPSYVETFGLPMLEAKLHKTIILASDSPFSHEILDGYEKAYFFDPFDANEFIKLMKVYIK